MGSYPRVIKEKEGAEDKYGKHQHDDQDFEKGECPCTIHVPGMRRSVVVEIDHKVTSAQCTVMPVFYNAVPWKKKA